MITITGSNFTGTLSVKFGGVPAKSFEVSPTGTSITATSPSGAGLVYVTVTTPGGPTAMTNKAHFRYQRARRR